MLLGLKDQNGFEAKHWAVISGKPSHFLVILIPSDEDALQKLKAFLIYPFLGFERVKFTLLGSRKI